MPANLPAGSDKKKLSPSPAVRLRVVNPRITDLVTQISSTAERRPAEAG
jgi:hypothetical protein